MAADDERRREIAESAQALAVKVGQLTDRLAESSVQVAALTARNEVLNEKSKKHSAWIWGTAAGLALDLVLSIGLLLFYDRQSELLESVTATQDQVTRSIRNQCGFLALLLGSYRPETRPPAGRAEYEAAFSSMRALYTDLRCDPEAIVPPATPTTPPPPPR